MSIKKLWKPEIFQGSHRKKKYFEGWYYKLISQDYHTVLAVIPGISIGESACESHSFIQVIDAITGISEYFEFPYAEFKSNERYFEVVIGENYFSECGINLNLENERLKLCGSLSFSDLVKYPSTFLSPGIMGPFAFVPKMECYHGIVNIHHKISGELTINHSILNMNGGEGYIEKDWGSSFPDSWIWIQGNHFEQSKASFMLSIANIPWLGRSFTGLIAFLHVEGQFYKIATYNGGKIDYINIQTPYVSGKIHNTKHILQFEAKQSNVGILKAPKRGIMQREITESITSEVALTLSDIKGHCIFQGKSQWVGMEISGEVNGRAI
ncbi:MAG: hypothetical protein EOM59_01665 [Clostridia bacterium]|nr:hypothetical protein [Clostridia bacterium]